MNGFRIFDVKQKEFRVRRSSSIGRMFDKRDRLVVVVIVSVVIEVEMKSINTPPRLGIWSRSLKLAWKSRGAVGMSVLTPRRAGQPGVPGDIC